MSRTRPLLTLALLAGILAAGAPTVHAQTCDVALEATYRVTFDATWSVQTHPTDFPNNAHFSPLIGATHRDGFHFWESGMLATAGMESMAETGATSQLTGEINTAIANDDAEFRLTGSGPNSPGMTSVTFDITSAHPAVTLVTMIAPSPDWFVGVDGLQLFENGAWHDELVIPLMPYDAGTDDGTMYTSANANSNPAQPITMIAGYPFQGVPLGTFTFTRLESEDLALCVDPLVAGQPVNLSVSYGTPSEDVVILWSTSLGNSSASTGSWCVDFGIDVPLGNPASRMVALGPFDSQGEYQVLRNVPASASGLTIHMQAAERNACPDSRMSNIVTQVVQ